MKKRRYLFLTVLAALLLAGCDQELKAPVPDWEKRITGHYEELVTFSGAVEDARVLQGVDALTGHMTTAFLVSEGEAAVEQSSETEAAGKKSLTAGALALSWRRLSDGEIDMLHCYWEDIGEERVAIWEENPVSDSAVSCILPSPSGGWLEVTADAAGAERAELLQLLSGLLIQVGEKSYAPSA